jgi:hypothetical protein
MIIWGSAPGQAQSQRADIEALKQQLDDLRRREAERQKQIDDLQRQIERLESPPAPAQPAPVSAPPAPASPLDQAIQELPTPSPQPTTLTQPTLPGLLSLPVGRGATLRLIDISADLVVGVGGSTEDNAELELLQGGDHDPRQNGFTLQQLELSFAGALDPYFTGETHVIFFIDAEGETRLELEEAFVTTQSLPFGLQVEAGFFFTEFGQINPVHPHAWDWVDQPIILSRLFGGDGIRQAGLRVGWLTPLPWFSEFHVGVQNANGETMVSFLANDEVFAERPIGGRPFVEHDVDGPEDLVYLLRWNNSWNLSPAVTGLLGFSALFGPNSTGPDGRTQIYGADFKVVWRPVRNFRGWPFLRWQTEFLWRNYEADAFTGIPGGEEEDGGNGTPVRLPRQALRDWGIYTQALYGFTYRWAAGLRFEYVTGSGASIGGRENDPFRDNRYRISPLLTWYASEFARIRLQYNYDRADHLANDDAHTVWLVFEGLYGAHPAHKF